MKGMALIVILFPIIVKAQEQEGSGDNDWPCIATMMANKTIMMACNNDDLPACPDEDTIELLNDDDDDDDLTTTLPAPTPEKVLGSSDCRRKGSRDGSEEGSGHVSGEGSETGSSRRKGSSRRIGSRKGSSRQCNGGSKREMRECCSRSNRCGLGQGDCDGDSECTGDLICGKNNCGPEFLWSSADCCTTVWESIVKSYNSGIPQQDAGTHLCRAMDEFDAINLINSINAERRKKRLNRIPPSNDMCATALFKGLVQKASKVSGATHDFDRSGVSAVLKMKRQNGWNLPDKLTSSKGARGSWDKPDDILGRSLSGGCYGCPKTSSGFENAHGGYRKGRGVCNGGTKGLVQATVKGWLNSAGHRAAMLNEGIFANRKWTRLGAAIMTLCENKGTNKETFYYWANSWFSDL